MKPRLKSSKKGRGARQKRPQDRPVSAKTRDPKALRTSLRVIWFLLLTAIAGVMGYFIMLTGFSDYDDEGMMMLTVKQYIDGAKLYETIFTFYGPVYYFYNWALRILTSTPVTHDVVRMSSLLPCLVGALICAWIVLRLTGSMAMATLVHLFACLTIIGFSHAEPGHPQELVLFLLLILASCPFWAPISSQRTLLMLSLGALPAALLLVKINVGAYAIGAVALAFVARFPRGRLSRIGGIAVCGSCVLIPLVLMRHHFEYEWARMYCWIAMASITAAVLCLMTLQAPAPEVSVRDAQLVGVGFSFAVASTVAIMAAQGVSPMQLWDSLVLFPNRFFMQTRGFFVPPPLSMLEAEWALVGLLAAAFFAWRRPNPGSMTWRGLLIFKALFSIVPIIVLVQLQWNGYFLVAYVVPFAWLVLFNTSDRNRDWQTYPRAFLCALTVMQTLYAFPVAGSQYRLIQILPFTVLMVCAGDSLVWLREALALPDLLSKLRGGYRLVLVGVGYLLVIMGWGYVYLSFTNSAYIFYSRLSPLALPGAKRLHVDPDQYRDLQWVAANVRASCDALETLPGMPSLSFWSGMYPLTGDNADNWMATFSDSQQKSVIAALARHPRACIVYNPGLVNFWTRGDNTVVDSLLLTRYIREHYRPVGNARDYYLMVRNERNSESVHIQ